MKSYPMFVLFIFSMICFTVLNADFSGELISRLSLKLKKQSMTDVEDLLHSEMKIFVPGFYLPLRNQNKLLDKMLDKAIREKTLYEGFTLDENSVNSIFDGRAALFMVEVPFKYFLIQSNSPYKQNSQFECLKQWTQKMAITLTLRRNLDKHFREMLNAR